MKSPDFDWIVVGGGAAGIAVGEVLTRMGLRVLLIEKNPTLASETTRIFHEWLHSGTLYALVPDNLRTMRYLLGALDDLFEYYSSYDRMNLLQTESGLAVKEGGWFNDQPMVYRYRSRPQNPIWTLAVARAMWLIEEVKRHDWLRQRAGSTHDGIRFNLRHVLSKIPAACSFREKFRSIVSADVSINSRVLLTDLLQVFESRLGTIQTDTLVERIQDTGEGVVVTTSRGTFSARHVSICAADGLSRFTDSQLKISYAPMFVVEGLEPGSEDFVELDYYVNRCINLVQKGNGIGLAAGVSVPTMDKVQEYLDYCIREHKLRNPKLRVVGSFVGHKKELVGKGENRNYLYHINSISPNVWSVVLGKFTLMFSLAPEFIRRVYHANPPRSAERLLSLESHHPQLSPTAWQDILSPGQSVAALTQSHPKRGEPHGHDQNPRSIHF